MIGAPELLLVGTVAAVGVLHTVVPDHWVPITLIARQRGWTTGEVARAAVIAGTGHTVSTLLIGLCVWLAGVAFATKFGNLVSSVSGVALIGFGLWVTFTSLRELRTAGGHRHSHGELPELEAHEAHSHPEPTHVHARRVPHEHWHEVEPAHDNGHDDERAQALGHDDEPAPALNHDHERTRALGHDDEPAPALNHDHERAHGLGHDHERARARGHDHEPAQSLGHDHEPARALGHDHERAHGPGHDHDRAPALGHDDEPAPALGHDHEREPALGHGHDHDHDHDSYVARGGNLMAGGIAVKLRHAHVHRHGSSTVHAHIHGHGDDTRHALAGVDSRNPPMHEHRHDRSSRTTLLLILGSSPMVEGVPAFFAAAKYGPALIALMAVVFATATIGTYVALSVSSVAGLQRVDLGPLERYGEVLSGAFIATVGLACLIFPVF